VITGAAVAAIVFGVAAGSADAAPPTVEAYFMHGTTASAVENAAYSEGCNFAAANPGGVRLLMIDFGAAGTR
jgi:hypothetical protein